MVIRMMTRYLGAVAIFLLSLLLSSGGMADPQLPPRTGQIVDLADLLEPFQEQPLATRFATLKSRNGVDFVVVTLPSLQGHPIESWGRLLGSEWSVGGKSGLGALLIVAPNDREVRIEIGKALSVMFPDRAAESIIDDEILPSFREGRLPNGILAGANAMIYQVTRPKMADVESTGSNTSVVRPSLPDLNRLRPYLPSQEQVMVGILVLFILFALYKIKVWRLIEVPDHAGPDHSGRTVYRDDDSSSWYSSSWRRHDRDHRSGGFGGFGSSGSSSSSSGSSWSSGFGSSGGSSRSSGGFSGSGSSRSYGGSSGGRSSGGGSSGRGASGRW
jgi:uncharacterized membrane protein YgcG